MKKETKKELYAKGKLPHACNMPVVDETEDAPVNTVDEEYSVPTWWTNSYGRSNTSYWD